MTTLPSNIIVQPEDRGLQSKGPVAVVGYTVRIFNSTPQNIAILTIGGVGQPAIPGLINGVPQSISVVCSGTPWLSVTFQDGTSWQQTLSTASGGGIAYIWCFLNGFISTNSPGYVCQISWQFQ